MRIYKKYLFIFAGIIIVFLFLLAAKINIQASQTSSLPSIAVINLIRSKQLGHEHDDLYKSLRSQWQVTSEQKISATWLLQYSVLEDKQMTDFAKNNMKNQEFGLLFEIDKNFAGKSNVSYRGQGPSYFSDGLLLVSYDTNERRKLIDKAFSKFKEIFGYYPKTVGAWYIGADSLDYMQKKYGIVATLKASDQFNLDVYTIWGAPWNIPYLSSLNNQLIPGESYSQSSKVVNLQWAARDPNQGYNDPLFSVQDFNIKGYDTNYIDYLSNIFLKTKNDNLVFGLENGGDLNIFEKYYKSMLLKANDLKKEKKAKIEEAKDFADQFLDSKNTLSDTNYLLAKDYKSNNQSFWYSTSNYRVYIQKNNEDIYLSDVRDYSNKIAEDYFILNNSQGQIRTSSPEILDTIIFPNKRLLLKKSDKPLSVDNKNNQIFLKVDKNIIGVFSQNKFNLFTDTKNITYDFSKKDQYINVVLIMMIIFFGYFIFSLHLFKKIYLSLSIFVPFFLSLPFLSSGLLNNLSFVFDKKELIFLNFFANPAIFSNLNLIFILQVMPLTILLIINYLCLANSNRFWKYIYYSYFLIITLIYGHIFYFPLDKSTFKTIILLSFVIGLALFFADILIFKFYKSKKIITRFLFISFAVFSLFFISIIFSRTKTILANFEIQALQIVKNNKKDVVLVSQVDYNVKPIYKAVKPFLYENENLAQKLTGTKWTNVLRPENNILKLTDYKNKLILIPRYLGSDMSKYEETSLGLTKIFDNYQIAIYEKK